MLKDLKNTIKQSAVYGLSRVASKLVSFILLPLYSINFTVAEYGVISRIETLWQVLFAVFIFGLESGIVRWYTKIENPEIRKKFLFSVSLFMVIINFLFTLMIFAGSGMISGIIFETEQYSNLVFYASLIATIEAFIFVEFLLLRINEKAFSYSFFSILIAVVNLLIQYYYLTYTQTKLEGVFLAKIIAPAIVFFILLPYYLRFLKFSLDIKSLKELIIYSFPPMLAGISSVLLNQSDRFLLGYFGSSSDVGLYSLAYNICGLLNVFVISPFSLAFIVLAWKKYESANAVRFFTKNITYLFFVTVYLALALSLATPNLIKIFTLNKDYWLAKDIVPWIAIAIPFYGISIIGYFSFYVTKKTYYILYFTTLCFIFNVILNILLIPYFGMYGAAISNFISFFLLCYLNYRYSKKNYFFKYEWGKIFLMVIVYAVLVFPFFYFQMFDFTILNVLLKIVAFILFPVILYILGFYEPIELERVNGFINKYLHIKINLNR